MSSTLHFEKWEGLGNDFILVETDVSAETARRLCDRRYGIGADGVLKVSRDPARMVVLNADGSRPEMCGNGLRCIAAWLWDAEPTDSGSVSIATDAGEHACAVKRLSKDQFRVSATMGFARITGRAEHNGRHFDAVDVGNPHLVSFDAHDNALLDTLGPALERDTEGGVNVELARQRSDGGIDVIVWERGVGRTEACGTGACAVAAAAVHRKLAEPEAPVVVHLPGGPLTITVGSDDACTMSGPARRVFRGTLLI